MNILHLTYQPPEKCHKVRKALEFFDLMPEKSSCIEGCTGCGIPINFHIVPLF